MKAGGAAWVGLGAVVLILFLPVTLMQPKPDKEIKPEDVKFGTRDWWTVTNTETGRQEKFPLWRFQQPLFFCTAVPFKITRWCGNTFNGWSNSSASVCLNYDFDYGNTGWQDHTSSLITPLQPYISGGDAWSVRWNVRGRPDLTRKSEAPPNYDVISPHFTRMRNLAKERKLFWRVHVTGISHRGRVLRGWYHLRVRLDWDRTLEVNKFNDGELSKYYVVDRLMISARGRTHSKTGNVTKRTWHGGIGEFVDDFPACQCKGLKYPNHHDNTTWEARCNEWNPCSYDRYPDEYHNTTSGSLGYSRKSGSGKCVGFPRYDGAWASLSTPPCGTVPTFEANYGNNFMYRRAKYPAFNGAQEISDRNYGLEQMDEIHVNFRLEQSFCNMYYDVDFVVDGVVIDARNIAREVVPLFSVPTYKDWPNNVDLFDQYIHTKDWNYGTLLRGNINDSKTMCIDSVTCVFAVERTISTRFVFTTGTMTAMDSDVNVTATPPTFYESADPLPTLEPDEELNCNVALKGTQNDKTWPISGENVYGAIKYVYSSEGPVNEVWEKRGHTLSYYDAQIKYNDASGQPYIDEIREVDPVDSSIYFDQTLAGDYMAYYIYRKKDVGHKYEDGYIQPARKCSDNDNIRAYDNYHYPQVTGRYDYVVSKWWGKQECGIGNPYRTPPTCDFLFLDRGGANVTDEAQRMTLRYLNTRTGILPESENGDFKEDVYPKALPRRGYQTVWWYKYFNPKTKHRISRRCQMKKVMKKLKCPKLLPRPWTPKPGDKDKVTQRIRNRVQRQRDWFNTTDRLERGMLIKNPGAWFVYDSRVMHGVHMSILTFFFMPVSAFMARFYKETFMETRIFTHHVWYWAHLVFVWMSGASYLVGMWRQRESRYVLGVNMGIVASIHRLIGWNSVLVMIFMIVFGGIRCIDRTYRKFAAYFHAVCAHVLHYSNLFCVVLSIYIPGSPSACFDRSWYLMEREHWYYFFFEPVVECVMVWMVFDIVMHAIMTHFQKQTDAMLELDKYLPKPRYLCPVMFPVLDENFAYDVPGRMKRIICLGIYIAGAATMSTITWIVIHATSSQNRGLGYMSCSHDTDGKILLFGTKPPPYYTKFPKNCESPWNTPLI